MERLTFKTIIHAKPQKVWQTLWNEDTYPQWTAPFAEGSHVKTDWQQGSKAYFLNKEGEGMVARILESRENAYMAIEHIGMVDKNGKEDLESKQVKEWAGAKENYTLTGMNGYTNLWVEVDTADSYVDDFQEVWPKALKVLKTLAENQP